MTQLTNKVVWITGASSGIGEALTYEMAKQGAKVILTSRREKELERVTKNCPGNPDNYKILPLDLSQPEALEAAAQKTEKIFGQIDILINNAGISQRSLVNQTILDVDRTIMEVNFFGAIALTKYVLPSMIARKSGHIVVVSSITGKFGTPLRSAYAASKHALHGYFDSLRSEVWQDNIKVSLICPGYIKTNVSINALKGDGSKYNQMDKKQAEGLSAAECAASILRTIQLERQETYIGKQELLGVYLKRFFPTLFSQMIRKYNHGVASYIRLSRI